MSNIKQMHDPSKIIHTQLGAIEIRANRHGISFVGFCRKKRRNSTLSAHAKGPESRLFRECDKQIREYIQGKRKRFQLKMDLKGTPFQKRVWKSLLQIPFGKTTSYGSIASNIGCPKAFRACGTAIGKNPISIIIPCHRVTPASGGVGNYAWGSKLKERLLNHEGRNNHS